MVQKNITKKDITKKDITKKNIVKENIIRASWGIVIHPKTGKILLTRKISDKSKELSEVLSKHNWKYSYQMIENLWASFTKWKIDGKESLLERAKIEIEEEGGVKKDNLKMVNKLWVLSKKKKVEKKITIYLFSILKDQAEYKPTDNKHIADFFDIEDASKLLKGEELLFLNKHKKSISKYISKILAKNRFENQEENATMSVSTF